MRNKQAVLRHKSESSQKEDFELLDGLFKTDILVTFSNGSTETMKSGELKDRADSYIQDAKKKRAYPVKVELAGGTMYAKTGLAIAHGTIERIADALKA